MNSHLMVKSIAFVIGSTYGGQSFIIGMQIPLSLNKISFIPSTPPSSKLLQSNFFL